jgi:hypothetical protein
VLRRIRSFRPGHSTAVAYLALFVALGGSSYAALRVTSRNVPRDALTGADIRNLTGADVRNESLGSRDIRGLLASDFQAGQLPGGRGPQGPMGPQGPEGPEGPEGPRGPEGPSASASFSSFGGSGSLFTQDVDAAELDLPAGSYLLYGNATFFQSGAGQQLSLMGPIELVDDGTVSLNCYVEGSTDDPAATCQLPGSGTEFIDKGSVEPVGTGSISYKDADIGAIELSSIN